MSCTVFMGSIHLTNAACFMKTLARIARLPKVPNHYHNITAPVWIRALYVYSFVFAFAPSMIFSQMHVLRDDLP